MANNDLGELPRARREDVAPADVVIADGPRRRTPALRRSKLATLAGAGVEHLTRLEQGRDRHPSAEILAALADTLRLSADERAADTFSDRLQASAVLDLLTAPVTQAP